MIQPIGKRVIIEPVEANETTNGFKLSDENSSMTPMRGTITALGDVDGFDVGEIIYFRRYSADELKYQTPEGEKKVFLVELDEILAKE